MVYVIADTHFGSRVVLKESRKEFKTQLEHDNTIIKNWKNTVKDEDTIYHLGDVGDYDEKRMSKIIKNLPGHKILILGNHDMKGHKTVEDAKIYWRHVGFDEVIEGPFMVTPQVMMSHYPMPVDTRYFINIHAHLHKARIDLPGYFNLSVDCNCYRPQPLDYYLKRCSNLRKIEKKYKEEWFADHYKEFGK